MEKQIEKVSIKNSFERIDILEKGYPKAQIFLCEDEIKKWWGSVTDYSLLGIEVTDYTEMLENAVVLKLGEVSCIILSEKIVERAYHILQEAKKEKLKSKLA